MATETTRSVREELPTLGAWVRKLARGLVRDRAIADDLAQEASLAALRNEDSIRGDLKPWLARVMGNAARRGWRDAVRRVAREHGAARHEPQPATDETAARLEIQRRLVQELAALAPAVREVLVRHYFDGWTSARIAKESGTPAATVRWRLQRGLAELRVRLDREHGGDGIQWRLALLPLCGNPSPWAGVVETLRPLAGAGTIPGALTMKAATQAMVATTLVAALGAGVWWAADRDESPDAPRRAEAQELVVAGAQPKAEEPETQEPEPAARETIASTPRQPAPAAEAAPERAGPSVSGRCIDERLVPIAGVRISSWSSEGTPGTSQGDGSFSLSIPTDGSGTETLRFEAIGFATTFVDVRPESEGETSLGDVLLRGGGIARGRVFGPDGAPFAGAEVTITAPRLFGGLEQARVKGPPGSRLLRSASGPEGRFEIAGVGLDPIRVWAGADGMRYAVSAPVDVPERGSTHEIELFLETLRVDDRITGIVLSPKGEAVSNAPVSVWEHSGGGGSSSAVHTDDLGRFELPAKPGHFYDLSAGDREDRWSRVGEKAVAPGTHDLELVFREAHWIDIQVRSAGEAVEEYKLFGEKEDESDTIEWAAEVTRPEGRGKLRAPTQPFRVTIAAPGYALAKQGPFSPDTPPHELLFELQPEPGVRGRVLAQGQPLADAKVSLHSFDLEGRIEHQGYPALYSPRGQDETLTDDEGRFVLRLGKAGTFVLRASKGGWAAADTEPMELEPRSGGQDIEIALGRGGALEGRVLIAAGRDPAGVIVALNRGDAHVFTVRSDAEGLFGFEGLTPGPWHLHRGAVEVGPGGGTSYSSADTPMVIPFNCNVREGEITYQDLDLRDFQPCDVSGVLLVNGGPAENWSVEGWPGAKEAMVGTPPSTAVAADGSFSLSVDEAGPLRLSFTPPAELGGKGRIDATIEVRPGPNEWREDFAMGRLEGRWLGQTLEGEEISLFYNSAKGATPSCWLPIVPDGDGGFALPFVPAGKGRIVQVSEANGDLDWTDLAQTEIPPGGVRELEIP